MRILAVGGGSGGHVTPVVPVLEEVKATLGADVPLEVVFVCDKQFETQSRWLMETASFPVAIRVITAGKLRRYRHFRAVDYLTTPSIIFANVLDVGKIIIGFFQSLWLLIRWRPDVVFAKGGYVCLPLGLAARLLRIPLSIHDSDTRPGLTNRLLARFAQSIATGYPLDNYRYPLSRSSYVGVPIKQEFRPVPALKQRELKQKLGFDLTRPLVVAVGGGLGAVSINTAMIQAAPRLIEAGVAALIVAGKANYDTAHSEAEPYEPHYRVVDFVPGLYEVLAAADIVVTRASATSLQELAGLKKPIIVVPARGLGDQHKNAQVYQEANAAVVLSDDELATGKLTPTLVELLSDTDRADLVASRLHEFARPDAAKAMAKIIIKTAQA